MSLPIVYIEGQPLGNCMFVGDDGFIYYKNHKIRAGIFRCKCGKEFRTSYNFIKTGHTTSCGCGIGYIEKQTDPLIRVNGKIRTEYNIWNGVKARCYNSNTPQYKDWGGRGITMCARWRNSFENFLKDVGERPSKNHSLDRYPNKNGNYTPSNTRWATREQQMRNTRHNNLLTLNGKTQCLVEWANELNIPLSSIRNRVSRKYSVDEILSTNNLKTGVILPAYKFHSQSKSLIRKMK